MAEDCHDHENQAEKIITPPSAATPTIHQTVYGGAQVRITHCALADFSHPEAGENEVVWLHCVGIKREKELKKILSTYQIHELVLEDILSVNQRPKIEDYGHYVFYVGNLFGWKKGHLHAMQISMIFGKNFMLSFQADYSAALLNTQDEIRNNKNNICQQQSDFLAYCLIDRIIDDYFVILDQFNLKLEKMDNFLLDNNKENTLQKIHKLRRESIMLRGALLPMQESLNMVMMGKIGLFHENTRIFMRDVVDHVAHLVSLLDSTRELINSMMDVYLSFQSNRLNVQMRVLTAITIIFMPLTLIAGIYGMNFTNMPELNWHHGYYIVIAIMLAIAVGLVYFFWKRKWF